MSVIYRNAIAIADKFVPPRLRPLWNHEAGKHWLQISTQKGFVWFT